MVVLPVTEIQSSGNCRVTNHPSLTKTVVFTGSGSFPFKTKNMEGILGLVGHPNRKGMGWIENLLIFFQHLKEMKVFFSWSSPPPPTPHTQIKLAPNKMCSLAVSGTTTISCWTPESGEIQALEAKQCWEKTNTGWDHWLLESWEYLLRIIFQSSIIWGQSCGGYRIGKLIDSASY